MKRCGCQNQATAVRIAWTRTRRAPSRGDRRFRSRLRHWAASHRRTSEKSLGQTSRGRDLISEVQKRNSTATWTKRLHRTATFSELPEKPERRTNRTNRSGDKRPCSRPWSYSSSALLALAPFTMNAYMLLRSSVPTDRGRPRVCLGDNRLAWLGCFPIASSSSLLSTSPLNYLAGRTVAPALMNRTLGSF